VKALIPCRLSRRLSHLSGLSQIPCHSPALWETLHPSIRARPISAPIRALLSGSFLNKNRYLDDIIKLESDKHRRNGLMMFGHLLLQMIGSISTLRLDG
jgi:hypothetical protein